MSYNNTYTYGLSVEMQKHDLTFDYTRERTFKGDKIPVEYSKDTNIIIEHSEIEANSNKENICLHSFSSINSFYFLRTPKKLLVNISQRRVEKNILITSPKTTAVEYCYIAIHHIGTKIANTSYNRKEITKAYHLNTLRLLNLLDKNYF